MFIEQFMSWERQTNDNMFHHLSHESAEIAIVKKKIPDLVQSHNFVVAKSAEKYANNFWGFSENSNRVCGQHGDSLIARFLVLTFHYLFN